MVRTQIQLDEEETKGLKRLAAERGVSVASLVREAVDRLLEGTSASPERWWDDLPTFNTGITDLAEEHDRYLAEDSE